MKKIFFIILIFVNISSNSWAWDGYDYDNDTAIEIGPGNLVREGLIFEYFDENLNEYRSAQVIELNNMGNGTELVVQDLEDEKQRTFYMQ